MSLSLPDSIPLANAVAVSIPNSSRKSVSTKPSSFHTTQAVFAMAFQPARQLHTSEVRHADSSARQSTYHAVHQGAESQVTSNTRPATWELSGGVPTHAELQRKRVANNDSSRRLTGDAVCGCSCDGSWRDRLWRCVHQHIHACSNV